MRKMGKNQTNYKRRPGLRKFNIDNMRASDDMTATALNIEEWNREEKTMRYCLNQLVSFIIVIYGSWVWNCTGW